MEDDVKVVLNEILDELLTLRYNLLGLGCASTNAGKFSKAQIDGIVSASSNLGAATNVLLEVFPDVDTDSDQDNEFIGFDDVEEAV